MRRKNEVWQAPESTVALLKGSGNQLNGLGEKERRPPKASFWHVTDSHDFAALQQYTIGLMYTLDGADEIQKAFRLNPEFRAGTPSGEPRSNQFLHRGPEPIRIANEKAVASPEKFSDQVKAFALKHAEDVGIAEMRPEWVYSTYSVDEKEKYVVALGIAHDYEQLSQAPSLPGNHRAIVEVGKGYTRGATAAAELCNFIRSKGYSATSYPGPTASAIRMMPAAIEAGLGELGKHGSLINRKMGSAFRLSAVTTDMPLALDQKDVFGADKFCTSCEVCNQACPPDAINKEKQWVRGDKKWYVDFDKCISFFAESLSCGIGIAVCPWSRQGFADNLLVKMARRKKRKEDEPAQQCE